MQENFLTSNELKAVAEIVDSCETIEGNLAAEGYDGIIGFDVKLFDTNGENVGFIEKSNGGWNFRYPKEDTLH